MERLDVAVSREFAVAAGEIWSVLRNFCGVWHPAIATMAAERSSAGALIRRFTVKGEDTIYREQCTYFSDSDKTLSYRHLEGIAGIASYAACIRVSECGAKRCKVDWNAAISAAAPRASAVAQGTKAIFELGLDALREASASIEPAPVSHSPLALHELILPGPPVLALTASGTKSESLCLFLHGIGGNRNNWLDQLPVAAGLMQAAALDLRGYGGSSLGPRPSGVDDYCADILRVMRHFKSSQIVLCGLSYGAWIATSFAMRHPEKVKGIILSGGCTGMSEANERERETFRKSREVPLNEGKTPRDFAPAVVDVIASPKADPETRKRLFDSMAEIPVATYSDALQCFTSPTEKFDFSRLAMPAMFITGEHDRLATPGEIRAVSLRVHQQANWPNVRFEVLAGAGHVCNIEAPAAYNNLLAEFLQSLLP